MSTPAVSARDRAWMRASVARFLQTPCSIQRFDGAWSTISADGLLCWVRADSREQTIPGATRTQQMRRWRITLPDGQDVRRGDRILALGTLYGVDEVIAPTSNSIDTNVLAWALWTVDADGNPTGPPLYLSFNATVSVTRSGTPVSESQHIRVEMAPPSPENLNFEGVQVSTTLLASPGTSWHMGDIVTIESLDGFTDLDQVTKSDVLSAGRQSGQLPMIRVFVRGTLQ